MYEKVTPRHPDKLADRIAGALVDYCYTKQENPRVAIEVLLGHGRCYLMGETSVEIPFDIADSIATRIVGKPLLVVPVFVPQDAHLASNQDGKIRCGDNGIFRGVPTTPEQKRLSQLARSLYKRYPSDGKFILAGSRLIICQSNADDNELRRSFPGAVINPLGPWTGGENVDSGATNRKLGSDMGDAVTGGGLHGKDLSKADVSLNIYAHIRAQELGVPVAFDCAIGDEGVAGIAYERIVETAREYIRNLGGFEKFAEWGLI